MANEGHLMQIQGVFGGLNDAAMQNYRITENAQIRAKNSNLEIINIDLEARLQEVVNDLDIFLSSKSWKITKPLRTLRGQLRR